MRMRQSDRTGFTLVEMLVVLVIVSVLLGIVFKLMSSGADQAAKAKTISQMERVKAALEEFYAEYGQYPPVPYYDASVAMGGKSQKRAGKIQPMRYEHPNRNGMRDSLVGTWGNPSITWEKAPIFTLGLMAFLTTRVDGHASRGWPTLLDDEQWTSYHSGTTDLARDTAAVRRWAPFLKDVEHWGWEERMVDGNISQAYTNTVYTVLDGWDRELNYDCPPPHQSYTLWSCGRDNDANTKKDNIYGHAGH